jgi:hypothetical protein
MVTLLKTVDVNSVTDAETTAADGEPIPLDATALEAADLPRGDRVVIVRHDFLRNPGARILLYDFRSTRDCSGLFPNSRGSANVMIVR